MNWQEYRVLSEKTMSSEFFCSKKEETLLHAVMGILTEVEELLDNHSEENDADDVNRAEEIGDIFFYMAIIGREYNLEYPQLLVRDKNSDPMSIVIKLIKNTCKLLDMMKKKLYYNKEINEESFIAITKIIMLHISDYCNYFDVPVEKTFDVNIEKLRARYGEKFSTDRAINRNLEVERNILEGKN